MKCLRCGEMMKHYKLNKIFNVYGKEHKNVNYSCVVSEPHNPQSIYECESCGYCELSTKFCEEQDV